MSISRTIFLLRDIYHYRGQFTRDRVQRTGDKLQRRETVYRGHNTSYRDVRQCTLYTISRLCNLCRYTVQRTRHKEQRRETRDKGRVYQTKDIVFFTFHSQETWPVAKTKENVIVVGKPQRCNKPDVKKAANLQNLAARYYSMTAKDYIGRLTHVVGDEF
jgi:hypothetical protein